MSETRTPFACRSDLSIGARLLWYIVVIEQMKEGGKPVLLTVDALSKNLGSHPNTVRDYRNELVAAGQLELVRSRPGAYYKTNLAML
ncbi:hypothetical protein ACFWFF_39560 [Streptomyces sp. NPDC060223]|uniref:hypothetical protein n=1 Tax=unclassified Streptomyces TaxID=2593676 RepID=UPI00363E084A